MSRPQHEVAGIIHRFGKRFVRQYQPNSYQLGVLQALSLCRTRALGGHTYRCTHCGSEHISYNSCRNRHCPKCQTTQQRFWVDDRLNHAYQVKHYHLVFTVPESLNGVCRHDSRWFYQQLFASVWSTIRQFGYTRYGVEPGAVCVLHTWGQNLSLHPHIHCLVPAIGYSLSGRMRVMGKWGKYLFPVPQLSMVFRGKLLGAIVKKLKGNEAAMQTYGKALERAWQTPWVVFCEASMGRAEHVIRYLGQYTHRVAISNRRITDVTHTHVTFQLKDYRDGAKVKTTSLTGEEFLRRFCLHILPKGFVRIRHYGIYSTRFRSTVARKQMVIQPEETTLERIRRVMGIDVLLCPTCHRGSLVVAGIIPRVRSPAFYHHPASVPVKS